MRMPENYIFSDNLELAKLGCTNPNYLGDANKQIKRPILHLFNSQCNCYLKDVHSKKHNCWVSSIFWKTHISEITYLQQILLFFSSVSKLVYYQILMEVLWCPWHSAVSLYYVDEMVPVLESFSSHLVREASKLLTLLWCPSHTI